MTLHQRDHTANADQQDQLSEPLTVTQLLAPPFTQVPDVSPLPMDAIRIYRLFFESLSKMKMDLVPDIPIDPPPDLWLAGPPSAISPPDIKFKKGDRVRFYDKSNSKWKLGEILDIELLDGYFANATVRYREYDYRKKQVVPKTTKIFADSWLQTLEDQD